MERARNEPCSNRPISSVLPRSRLHIGAGWIHLSRSSRSLNDLLRQLKTKVNRREATEQGTLAAAWGLQRLHARTTLLLNCPSSLPSCLPVVWADRRELRDIQPAPS